MKTPTSFLMLLDKLILNYMKKVNTKVASKTYYRSSHQDGVAPFLPGSPSYN